MEVNLRDRCWEPVARETLRVSPGDRRVAFAVEGGLAGNQILNLRLLTGPESKVVDWGSFVLDLDSKVKIAGLSFNRPLRRMEIPVGPVYFSLRGPVYKRGERVEGSVRLNGTVGRCEVVVELLDNYLRVVEREELDRPTGNAVRFSLPSRDVMTSIAWVRTSVRSGDQLLDSRKELVWLRQPPGFADYDVIVLWSGGDYGMPWLPLLDRRLRDLGVTVWGSPHRNYKYLKEVSLPGLASPDGPAREPLLEAKAAFFETGDVRFLDRGLYSYCLDSPDYRRKLRGYLESALDWPVKPVGVVLGDEQSLTCYTDPFDICWSAESLAGFREWLKGEYGSLDSLNREWETGYRSWEEVRPLTTEEAQRKGNYAPWADHRTYMESVLARTYELAKWVVDEVAPGTPVAVSGTQAPAPHNGIDWRRIDRVIDFIQPYPVGDQNEYHRSWIKGYQSGWTGYSAVGERLRFPIWQKLFHGYSGSSIFWQYCTVNPDFTFSRSGRELSETIREIRYNIYPLLHLVSRRPGGISIHYSQASIHGSWILDGKIPRGVSTAAATSASYRRFADNRHAWTKILEELGYQYEFLASDQITSGELDRFKLLILPYSIAVSRDEERAIAAFVAGGGVLLVDAAAGRQDGHCRWMNARGLFDILGIRPAGAFRPPDRDAAPVEVGGELPGGPGELAIVPAERELGLNGGKPLALAGGGPVLVRHRHGKGWAMYLNFFLDGYAAEAAYDDESPDVVAARKRARDREREALRRVISGIVSAAGIEPGFSVVGDGGDGLTTTERFVYEIGGKPRLFALIQDILPGKDPRRFQAVFPLRGHIYDVRRGKYLGYGDRVESRIGSGEAVLFAVWPYRLASLVISCRDTVKRGGSLTVKLELHGGGDAWLPQVVHLEVRDPAGNLDYLKTASHVVKDGEWPVELRTAYNAPPGTWTLLAREAVSGVTAEANFVLE